MKIELLRYHFTDKLTLGRLSLGGVLNCFSLEQPVREPSAKVKGATAIPAGTYGVIVDMSKRFQRMMPLLVNVPGFAGVRIHPGNMTEDTEGCILVGLQIPPERDRLLASRIAFEDLFLKIEREFTRGQRIDIEIIDSRPAA